MLADHVMGPEIFIGWRLFRNLYNGYLLKMLCYFLDQYMHNWRGIAEFVRYVQ